MIISCKGLRVAALIAGLLLWGCAAQGQTPAPTPSPVPTRPGELTPYTPPPASTLTPTLPAPFTPAPVPSITPTPLTYVVKANDDLGLIAYRFGVTVAAIQAANPNVDPRAMRIGTVLVIPASPRAAASAPTALNPSPTPVPVELSGPDCWPSGDGGLWCFLLAHNSQPGPLENISVKVRVGGESSGTTPAAILERSAYGLLDRLPAGKSLPLAVFFAAPVPSPARASAELLLSFPLAEDSARYLDPELDGVAVTIAPDGLSAEVKGQVALADGKASVAWIAAAALEADGRVVAVRRWENSTALEAGKPSIFDLTLFSLGGKIARVELLAEARP